MFTTTSPPCSAASAARPRPATTPSEPSRSARRSSRRTPLYRASLAENCLNRGLARRALGDPAGAAADVRRAVALYDALPSRSVEEWFLSACAHAALAGLAGRAGTGTSAAEGEEEATRAMGLLHHAVAMGYRSHEALPQRGRPRPAPRPRRLPAAADGPCHAGRPVRPRQMRTRSGLGSRPTGLDRTSCSACKGASRTDRSPAWPGIDSTDSSADGTSLTGPQRTNIRWKARGLRLPRPEAQDSPNRLVYVDRVTPRDPFGAGLTAHARPRAGSVAFRAMVAIEVCSILIEIFQRPRRRGLRSLELRRGLEDSIIRCSTDLRDQLVDANVPGHVSDSHHGGFLTRIKLDDAARSIVSQAGHDDAVAGLEPRRASPS